MTAATKLLDRLNRVRQTGPGRWLACCPAHADRSPSLSIREIDDRVLVYDFAGCEVGAVLAAVGLQLCDLFEKPLGHSYPQSHSRVPARDVMVALDHEILVAVMILNDVIAEQQLSAEQLKRLTRAAARIGNARDQVAPLRTESQTR
jgi:hypothetical protein